MKKLSFQTQLYLGLAFLFLGLLLSTILKNGFFANAGGVLYGLLFVINPIFPARCKNVHWMKLSVRSAGILIVFLSAITHFGV